MKTVAKTSLACLAALAGFALCFPTEASAEVSSALAPLNSSASVNLPESKNIALPTPAPSALIPPPAVGSAPAPSALGALAPISSSSSMKGEGNGKVPDSVKDTVKRLGSTSDNVTLEDLNSAREAIAKLDLLIDIEKRLNDLATLRQEREGKSGSSLASAIPASALSPKIVTTPMPMPSPSSVPALSAPSSALSSSALAPLSSSSFSSASFSSDPFEILRIAGSAGHYIAYVKGTDGKLKLYHDGDKMADGTIVKSISSHGMTVEKNKKTHTVKVKDVTVVFNGR